MINEGVFPILYSFIRFKMKCHLCVNYIEMQTDPASCDYVIVSGAQRKEERWDMSENEQILTTGQCGGRSFGAETCCAPQRLTLLGAQLTLFSYIILFSCPFYRT